MELAHFRSEAEDYLHSLENLISMMPHKGDKETESQKVALQNRLNELRHTFNGVTQEDLQKYVRML